MAIREMRRLAAAARRRWGLRKVAMVHRVGVVPVGEPSVVIAVSAAHREEAFAAGRWLIDRLKEIVPIWKKERYRDGAVWIGAQQGGPPRRRAAIYPAGRGR
jgi:molybdopterin synthase catalytic subunit